MNRNITIVTGLWDMGRGDLEGWAKRDFSYYKDRFFEMLETDAQMCIWIPKDLEEEVQRVRKGKPTKIFIKNLKDFETWNPFYKEIQKIRTDENWLSQADWLRNSPQAALKYYNPMMFTKMFMLSDSAIVNPFDSEYFFWIDGGLTNTVSKGYFQDDLVLDNLINYVSKNDDKFIHLAYPYEGNDEIHGFERKAMAEYCETDFVRYVCRGGFFGGRKDDVRYINSLYYSLLEDTLRKGYMGADECFFTILTHKYPNLIHKFDIDGSGLVWPFFEELKNHKTEIKIKNTPSDFKTSLYMLTFNFPEQVRHTLETYKKHPYWLDKTRKILVDNSNNDEAIKGNSQICDEYGFEHIITGENLGINRGRLLVAEHFQESDSDYYIFLEDDMGIHQPSDGFCRNGFRHYVPDLYNIIHKIMIKEDYDFLKLSFTEVYMDNNIQCSWYNVPKDIRSSVWPHYDKLPINGLDPNCPRTKFDKINNIDGLSYIDGEVYYANWPMIASKKGNQKMFLDTKWAHPYEQTWMSYIFQETLKHNIKPAVLLASPINHNRIVYYEAHERREN